MQKKTTDEHRFEGFEMVRLVSFETHQTVPRTEEEDLS
jgi:hypothetical protein